MDTVNERLSSDGRDVGVCSDAERLQNGEDHNGSLKSCLKRHRSESMENDQQKDSKRVKLSSPSEIPAHPQGVQPLGNIYLDDQGQKLNFQLRECIGYFGMFPDDLLLTFLSYLSPFEVMKSGIWCKMFYILSRDESLWRNFVIENFDGCFSFFKTWKDTFISNFMNKNGLKYEYFPSYAFDGCYSDILYQPWHCGHVDLEQWSHRDNIDRRSNLSLEEFIEEYEKPGKPVILTDIVPQWLSYNDDDRKWTKENLLKRFGDVIFKAGAIEMTLNDYWNYIEQTQEESPIYLFDNEFIEKANGLGEEYTVAPYFQKDFFNLLNDKPKIRPSYRWILIGPPRSGSTFHKDPNYTSAWNGVISGRKKWIMFPPNCTPPGVLPSCDELDVTTPISVTEWFLNFYRESRKFSSRTYECVQKPGELIFIPHMWWHTALNLEECVAVTQNYVNEQNLMNVLDFLRRNGKSRLYGPIEQNIDPSILQKLKNSHEEKKEKTLSPWSKFVNTTESDFKFSFGE